MAKWTVGVDLGGTFIKFCLLDDEGNSPEVIQRPTPAGPEAVVAEMAAGARQVVEARGLSVSDILGVGIGSPGPLDLKNGIIIATPNIPGMDGCRIRDRLTELLGAPAMLENDANAAAYGEYIAGAGKGAGDMVLLTLGTGVGTGIILNGEILHGQHGMGAEGGHILVEPNGELCGCGQRGCLERYCSATYMADWAARQIEQRGADGALARTLAEKGSIDARDVNEARKAGDELAGEAWDRCVRYLAQGCVTICRLFDPDVIAFAGGLTRAGDDLMVPLAETFARMHWTFAPPMTELRAATLGGDAGAIGAAGLAMHHFA